MGSCRIDVRKRWSVEMEVGFNIESSGSVGAARAHAEYEGI